MEKKFIQLLIQTILDLYSIETSMPIAFINKKHHMKAIWQTNKEYCSPLCKYLYKIKQRGCEISYLNLETNESRLVMCPVGLWYWIIPIIHDKTLLGYVITGQRRINKKDTESLNKLSEFKNNIDPKYHNKIENLFNATPIIEEKIFEQNIELITHLIDKRLISSIEYLEEENRRTLNLTHELLIPIQSIINKAEIINLHSQDPEIKQKSQEIIHLVLKSSKITENMRSTLFNVSKPVEFKLLSLKHIIDENIDIFRTEAEQKGLEFRVDDFSKIFIPGSMNLPRAFFNLIYNAVKYSYYQPSQGRKGYIDIKGKWVDGKTMYQISISNYGLGILENEKNNIFKVGYRGRLSSDRIRTGSGVGLADVKRVIEEEHKGKITFQSQLLGNDEINSPYMTTFYITLPVKLPLRLGDRGDIGEFYEEDKSYLGVGLHEK